MWQVMINAKKNLSFENHHNYLFCKKGVQIRAPLPFYLKPTMGLTSQTCHTLQVRVRFKELEKSTKMVMEFHSYHCCHTTFFAMLLLLRHPLTPPYVGILVHL
jgi:hypothetical protein